MEDSGGLKCRSREPHDLRLFSSPGACYGKRPGAQPDRRLQSRNLTLFLRRTDLETVKSTGTTRHGSAGTKRGNV